MTPENPYTNQVQSFKRYAEYVKAKRLADKMYTDNLLAQLAEAKATIAIPMDNSLSSVLKILKTEVSDLHKQFIIPNGVVISAKTKRKIKVAQALAKL